MILILIIVASIIVFTVILVVSIVIYNRLKTQILPNPDNVKNTDSININVPNNTENKIENNIRSKSLVCKLTNDKLKQENEELKKFYLKNKFPHSSNNLHDNVSSIVNTSEIENKCYNINESKFHLNKMNKQVQIRVNNLMNLSKISCVSVTKKQHKKKVDSHRHSGMDKLAHNEIERDNLERKESEIMARNGTLVLKRTEMSIITII